MIFKRLSPTLQAVLEAEGGWVLDRGCAICLWSLEATAYYREAASFAERDCN
jgi:hypothetical protein